ncbi:hypothetical protein [Halocatena marina]|uniref:hypothetical protein n=1 Tax=Halocatena marina TaxID=2934937 RepID=UPI00200DAFB7|nr:hypothetical protein [Halocatena marina]
MVYPVSTDSFVPEAIRDAFREIFEHQYDDVVVYGDRENDVVLHEGPVRMRGDGWLELPTGRLISPEAVHHIDIRSEN